MPASLSSDRIPVGSKISADWRMCREAFLAYDL